MAKKVLTDSELHTIEAMRCSWIYNQERIINLDEQMKFEMSVVFKLSGDEFAKETLDKLNQEIKERQEALDEWSAKWGLIVNGVKSQVLIDWETKWNSLG